MYVLSYVLSYVTIGAMNDVLTYILTYVLTYLLLYRYTSIGDGSVAWDVLPRCWYYALTYVVFCNILGVCCTANVRA